jgi:hypothetical protein
MPVGADESPSRLVAHLKWKPANLTVNVQPHEADVLLDDKQVVRSGQMVPITIDDNSLDGRREVAVKVSAAGYKTQDIKVKLRAAETRLLPVELKSRDEE